MKKKLKKKKKKCTFALFSFGRASRGHVKVGDNVWAILREWSADRAGYGHPAMKCLISSFSFPFALALPNAFLSKVEMGV
jgi:hypothetical protein